MAADLRFQLKSGRTSAPRLLAVIANPACPALRGRTSWRPVRRLLVRPDQVMSALSMICYRPEAIRRLVEIGLKTRK
jgi:hypothetical protein